MRLAARRLTCCGTVLAGLVLTGCVAQRPEDPVVITGAQVPRLAGATPGAVVAFRWMDGRWEQVPVQVDERAQVDLGRVYDEAPNGVTQLTYTDPGTFTGPDPDPKVDADDEIALMGIDSGVRAPAGSRPAGVVAGSGHELRVTDPLGDATPAYVYLFRQAGGLDPAAGRSYVDYRFGLRSGDYKTTYGLQQGPNPEDSTITTAAYTRHFSDRWIDDGLTIRSGGATGADILDRHKNLFAPGNCVRSEDTFSAAEGAFVVNKSGPVRALRAYIGANSGPYTERTQIYYAQREDIITDLRVHAIPSVMDFFDYSPAASGMTYTNDRNPGGVTIDGQPDTVAAGAPTWEKVSGSQGTLTHVWQLTTNVAPLSTTNYYYDNSTVPNPVVQCTGDAFAYGSSGTYINSGIANTDPHNGAASYLTATHTLFFESPGQTNESAQTHADQVRNPAQVSSAAWTGS